MLKYETVSGENWHKHRKFILHSEKQFPSKIRTCQKEYLAIVSGKSAIAVAAYSDDEYVGNAVGYGLAHNDLNSHPGLESLKNPEEAVYLFNLIVEKKFRGSGLGKEILRHFCQKAKELGFKSVVGHFRDKAAAGMMKKLGATELAVFDDWEGTGERYILLQLYIL